MPTVGCAPDDVGCCIPGGIQIVGRKENVSSDRCCVSIEPIGADASVNVSSTRGEATQGIVSIETMLYASWTSSMATLTSTRTSSVWEGSSLKALVSFTMTSRSASLTPPETWARKAAMRSTSR